MKTEYLEIQLKNTNGEELQKGKRCFMDKKQ